MPECGAPGVAFFVLGNFAPLALGGIAASRTLDFLRHVAAAPAAFRVVSPDVQTLSAKARRGRSRAPVPVLFVNGAGAFSP